MEKNKIESYLEQLGYAKEDDFYFSLEDIENNFTCHKIILQKSSEKKDRNLIKLVINILKLLGIKFTDNHSFSSTQDNLKKLPSKKELSMILENSKNNFNSDYGSIYSLNNLDDLNRIQLNINKVNPIIKPSSLTSNPQGNEINSPSYFKNIWHDTKRGNSLRFAKGYDNKFTEYLRDTQAYFETTNEKSHDFFIGFFSKAFQEMEKKMSEKAQSFSWQDAINTLAIAKAFGGLSNIKKDGRDEGYTKITDPEFITAIRQKFPEVIDFQSLDSAKLGQYKIFSKLYQKTTQDILKSNRGTNNQTGLRLTFFPDHAIERLLGIKETKDNFKENIAQSAQIIDDFIKPKPKLMIASV